MTVSGKKPAEIQATVDAYKSRFIQPETAEQAPSFSDRLSGFFKAIPGGKMAQGIAQIFGTNIATKAAEQDAKTREEVTKPLERRIRTETDTQKREKLKKILAKQFGAVEDINVEDVATGGEGYVKPREVAGSAIQLATVLGSLGIPLNIPGGGSLMGAKTFLPQSAGQAVKLGVTAGATGGAGSAIQDAPDLAAAGKDIGIGSIIGLGGGLLEGLGQVIGRGASRAGTKLIGSQADIPASMGRSIKLDDVVGKMADYGITNIDDYERIAGEITGANGRLSKLVREAAGRSNPVDTEGIMDMARAISEDPSLPPGTDKKFFDAVKRGLVKAYGGSKGSIATKANPSEIFGFIQDLEGKSANIRNIIRRSPMGARPEDEALASAYQQVADELKERLFVQSGGDNVVLGGLVDDNVANELAAVMPGNKNWQKLIDEVRNAKSVADLRSLQAPFVKASQVARETAAREASKTFKAGDMAKGLGKYVNTPWAPLNLLGDVLNQASPTVGKVLRGAPRPINNEIVRLMERLAAIMAMQQASQEE